MVLYTTRMDRHETKQTPHFRLHEDLAAIPIGMNGSLEVCHFWSVFAECARRGYSANSHILALVRMLNLHSSSLRLGHVGVCYDLALPGETLLLTLSHQSQAWINAFTVFYPGTS